ncbi:MAG: AAA ATPase central domain protein [Candidatus Uhrbacteria bacterium GW2011_GWF2_39_13]|uniref:AAA ATPase central domain protein n=1 Tax=Candidatus Uhrbacteria bacterium GW2011_GWF2_39_13 TaxID=1618995 RepID=A0A0G0MHL7_9BACT|nr:MAG: AAA ATPase central domain protein [Candidatus Uhrbacteria bacterium GW2011_GWF2_39_13]
MEYIIEISRIIEGALSGDKKRVLAYLEQLSKKLKQAGDESTANMLLRHLKNTTNDIASASNLLTTRLPVDSESRLSLADESFLHKGEVAIVMPHGMQEKVKEFLSYVRNSAKLMTSGVGISPSMLIYGPPGVGKTELARYIASELELPLLTARTDSLISSYLGSTSKNLRLLFDHANSRPCILFLDEFDAIAKLRDDQYELGELKRVVISLLQNIDSLNHNTILLAATNHHHLLDPAIWRRFTYQLEFSLPSLPERKQLIEIFLKNYKTSKIDITQLADIASELSGAAIKQICENAIRQSILSKKKTRDGDALLKDFISAKLPQQFSFDIKDSASLAIFNEKFKGKISQSKMAELFSTSNATISRKINEVEIS